MLIVADIFAALTLVFFIAMMSTYNAESKVGYLNNFYPMVIGVAVCGAIAAVATVIHFA